MNIRFDDWHSALAAALLALAPAAAVVQGHFQDGHAHHAAFGTGYAGHGPGARAAVPDNRAAARLSGWHIERDYKRTT
ncbi:hypothetical protein ACFWZU_07055 [Frateuria sp. GZRR33]|uniref:hypothetical protein n=1 Tax=Frateuria sp. GZRR33 TaxID=3351535 RepID=UPI003EDBAD8E